MATHFKKISFSVILFFVTNNFFASDIIKYTNSNDVVNIGGSVMILEDRSNNLTINEVISSSDFKESKQEVPNLNITPYTYWIKLQIQNLSETPSLLLDLAHPIIDEVEFYNVSGDTVSNVEKMGEYLPFDQRKYKHQDYIFKVNTPQKEVRTIYLKVKSGDQVEIRLLLGAPKSILESLIYKDFLFGIYCGLIIVMCLYNAFVYFSVRDNSYLHYVIYTFLVGLTQACIHGYSFRYLWPNSPWLAIQGMQLVPALAGISLIQFSRTFLKTKEYLVRLDKGFYALIGIYVVGILLTLFKMYNASQQIIQLTAMLLSLYLLFIAFRISRKGYRPANFFLIAWTALLVSVCVFVLQNAGVISYSKMGSYTLAIGSAVEVILLSFALADRINILRKEKEDSQKQVVETLKENEKIVREQNIVLEQKVHERTSALEASNKDLKEAQTQLVNAEKMASLGQLTAGIAHEINNPINFVTANIKPLQRDVEDIMQVLGKYSEIKDEKNLSEKLKEIDELKKQLDTDYLTSEINMLLKGIDEGGPTELLK